MKIYKFKNSIRQLILVSLLFFISAALVNAQNPSLAGSRAFCDGVSTAVKKAAPGIAGVDKSVTQSSIILNTDFVSAGVGGLRNTPSGQISLAGVSGTVTKAYLYWHGVSQVTNDVGTIITVNGSPAVGTSLGVSHDNCWSFNNSQAYRADVTALVTATGNGIYVLTGFGSLNLNGASLIVFFNDADNTNNRDVVIFDGNDSNVNFAGIPSNPNAPADPTGWNVLLSGINYTAGTASIQLHVSDGQDFPETALLVNAVVIAPAGGIFQGTTVPGANNGPSGNGRLWDIQAYDVTSFLTPGPNSLNLTTGYVNDCLGLIAALVDLPAGAAPVVCTTNAVCKSATVYLVNGTATLAAADVDDGSTSTCPIASITVDPSSFDCSNIGDNTVTLTVTDSAGGTSTCTATVTVVDDEDPVANCKPATVTLANGTATITAADVNDGSSDACGILSLQVSPATFSCANIGDNTVTLTVTDSSGNTSTCTAVVTVIGEIPSCIITAIPSNDVYTGGVPTNIYLGYGPQSVTLSATASGGSPFTYSWSPTTGLSDATIAAPVFTPTTAGTYVFTLTVTNTYGCTSTCTITICVTDIRVPGTDGKKVYICHTPDGNPGNAHTLSVSVNAVPSHLSEHSGDKLGACDQVPCTASPGASLIAAERSILSNDEKPGSLIVSVSPNPTSYQFTFRLRSNVDAPVSIRILNGMGQVVVGVSGVNANSTVSLGAKLRSGAYMAEVTQGNNRQMIRLMKGN
ncbi:MAG: T9SS type A sorting domain-containing protein [Bacteroidota bacterium]